MLLNIRAICADEFPKGFKFGVATAAYQVEGAWNVSGKTESIWDFQTHTFPDRIVDKSNGDIACDAYHKMDEDIKNLKYLGVDFYRFSISWPRLLPTGILNIINPDGVRYYNELIDKLLENNIEPVVTIYHWDLPQALHQLGGWTTPTIADYYADYAELCFKLFGDRVKTWITFNEPSQVCALGYGTAELAPYYSSDGFGMYICAHNLLNSHARVYHLYDKRYRRKQQGRIGITIETSWWEPFTNSSVDVKQADIIMQQYFGWYAHPIFSREGDYPKVMRQIIDAKSRYQNFPRSRLPKFTNQEIERLRGSSDFLGLNHYTTFYVRPFDNCNSQMPSRMDDMCTDTIIDETWGESARNIFRVVPWGLRKLLNWIKDSYGNVEVLITENGYAGFPDEGLNDSARIVYLTGYLKEVQKSISEDGCNVVGYTFWSFMDNFEWTDGYTMRFGLFNVDFNSMERTRCPKRSADVYKKIIATRVVNDILL